MHNVDSLGPRINDVRGTLTGLLIRYLQTLPTSIKSPLPAEAQT